MMPGPPPIPVERKRARGNPGKQSLPAQSDTAALRPAKGVPQPPDHLDERGLDVWRRVWKAAGQWVSPETDRELMIRYCEAQDEREQLRAYIARNGLSTTGSQGQEVLAPQTKRLETVEKQMTKYEQLLGLTPVDRSRLGLAEVKKASALEEFFANRNRRDQGGSG